MIGVLIFFIIIYIMIKKSGNGYSGSKEEILNRKGFHSVKKIYENGMTTYYSAIKRGENYFISYMNAFYAGMNDVNLLTSEMKKYHYHKGILICRQVPALNLVEYGKVNSIEVVTIFDLKNEDNVTITSQITKNENYSSKQDDGPIRDFKKSNFRDFFKKPDRL